MKKLLISGIVATMMSAPAFAGGITYLGKITKEFDVHVKTMHIDGFGDATIVGLSYTGDKDIGDEGGFGFLSGIEFDYGEGFKADNEDVSYMEFSWKLALSYMINDKIKVYGGVKAGYADYDSTGGYIISGIGGAQYGIGEHFKIGVEAAVGKNYVEDSSVSLDSNSVGAYIGYAF